MHMNRDNTALLWGGYPRISDDPHDLRRGFDRQVEDITEAVAQNAGDPEAIAWYPENNTSAYKKKRTKVTDPLGNEYWGYRVIRPQWHTSLQDLRLGRINALMVWDLDRLARDPRDLEDAIEAVEYYGAVIKSATASEIDLMTESGRMMARVMIIIANKSSADTARRVKRAHKATAAKGLPVGGTRPFGWLDDKMTLNPTEAGLIRQAAQAVIDGVALRSIVTAWNAASVKTSTGRPWSHQTMRQMLRSPRLSGWRVYQGGIAKDPNGSPVRGVWEPILDQDTHDRLVLALAKPERRGRVPRKGARHYLLTGLIRCGVDGCNRPMYGNRHAPGRHYYTCRDAKDAENRTHTLTISGNGVDGLIENLLLRKLQEEELETQPGEFQGQVRLDEIAEKKRTIMERWRTNRLSDDLAFGQIEALEEEEAELQEQRSSWLVATTGPKRVTPEKWLELCADERSEAMDRRRAIVEDYLGAVMILPPKRPTGNSFDPARVRPVDRRKSAERAA